MTDLERYRAMAQEKLRIGGWRYRIFVWCWNHGWYWHDDARWPLHRLAGYCVRKFGQWVWI